MIHPPQIIGIIASLINLAAIFILGRRGKPKRMEGWLLYIASQGCWLAYALIGHLYEMLILNFGATAIAMDNLWDLRKRMLANGKKKTRSAAEREKPIQ
jgi:hypothetical protein